MQTSNDGELWARFQQINERQQLAHALLLIGMESISLVDFSYKMAAAILCRQDDKPCYQCKSCRLVSSKEHPDLSYIGPDKSGGMIKIDQIRDLHHLAYTSPQLGNKRVFILNPVDKLNSAAANALLKLLEEPPNDVYFLLSATQIVSLPPTIISRCQRWQFNHVFKEYSKEFAHLIDDLEMLFTNKISSSALAEKWATYEFNQLLRWLYLFNCQLIDYKIIGKGSQNTWSEKVYQLAHTFHPVHLFKLLDQLNDLSTKLQRNININQQLSVETLLLSYTS